MQCSRRRFIVFAASLASTVILIDQAQADAPVLAETDPTAQSLGYRTDAANVDKAKYPQYRAGQTCANCGLFQGKPGDANGPCPIFAGKLVNAKGWCSAYVKKA
jgi:High potential iron-sulfur protein